MSESRFTTAMRRGIDRLYSDKRFGQPVVYVQADGWRTDCQAQVERDLTRYGDTLEINAAMVEVRIRTSELPDRPQEGEKVEIGTEVLVVSKLIGSDDFEHRFIAT